MLPTDNDMTLINQYSRYNLTKDDVYIFSMVLCDNDIDRDFECFTVDALFELEKLFVGKTGIIDFQNSSVKQVPRIFECAVEAVKGKKTQIGDDYFRLTAKAYILKNESTKDIIQELDCKEISIGCAVRNALCSICGNKVNSPYCEHKKGKKYKRKLCYTKLDGVYDAYEFSVVNNKF